MEFEVDGQRVFAAGRLPAGSLALPVVLVHGAAMDHTVWVYHMRYFMHIGRPVLALDLPAHGRSAGVPLASIEALAAWLARCLAALAIEQAAVAGHSMGALVALELAGQMPGMVAALALLGVACPMPVSDQLLAAAKVDAPAARDMMMVWGHASAAQLGANPVAGIHIVNSTMRLLEAARAGLLYNDLMACNNYSHGAEAAAAVSAPATLLCGAEDRMAPPAAARQLAALIPRSKLQTITGSGHIMMSEQPEQTHRHLVAALTSATLAQ